MCRKKKKENLPDRNIVYVQEGLFEKSPENNSVT